MGNPQQTLQSYYPKTAYSALMSTLRCTQQSETEPDMRFSTGLFTAGQ